MWQRWNQSTHIFEKSTDNGASWTPLGLSGSIITEGTIADARLSSNVALKNVDNAFSANQSILLARPNIKLQQTGFNTPARFGQWNQYIAAMTLNVSYDAVGNWNLDDTSAPGYLLQLDRSSDMLFYYRFSAGANPRPAVELLRILNDGRMAIPGSYYELGRGAPQGFWMDIPYSSSNFGANPGSWTVSAGNILGHAYAVVGKTMFFSFVATGTAVSGSPGYLAILLPTGYTVGKQMNFPGYAIDNSGNHQPIMIVAAAGNTNLQLYKLGAVAWTNSGGSTALYITCIIPLQ